MSRIVSLLNYSEFGLDRCPCNQQSFVNLIWNCYQVHIRNGAYIKTSFHLYSVIEDNKAMNVYDATIPSHVIQNHLPCPLQFKGL